MQKRALLIIVPCLLALGLWVLTTSSQSEELVSSQLDEPVTLIVKYTEDSFAISNPVFRDFYSEVKLERTLEDVTSGELSVDPFVEFPEGSAEAQIEANRKKYPDRSARVTEEIELPAFETIKKVTVEKAVSDQVYDVLSRSSGVEYVEFEGTPVPTTISPDDTYYLTERPSSGSWRDSWALRKIGLNPTDDGDYDSGWDVTHGSTEVVVGVYGTGIDYTHPDLAANIWVNPGEDIDQDGEVWDLDDMNGIDDDCNGKIDDLIGWSFNYNSKDVYDDGSAWAGHDTQVAGIVGAVGNNGIGSTGVGWNIKLMALKYGGYSEVIQYATDNGADVVNFSWTGAGAGLKSIVDYAHANGTIIVFSSANDGAETINYSSSLSDHTWIVGSTDINDNRYGYSNYGKRLDFTAPGGNVLDTLPSDIKGIGFFTLNRPLSVAVTPDGDPALAYYNPEDDTLRYGVFSGVSWSFEEVTSGEFAGMYVSLAIGSDNKVHLSYYDWDNYCLKYSVKAGGVWTTESLTTTGDQGYFTSIAVGGDLYPRIGFVNKTDGNLRLATWSGSDWGFENVVNVGGFSTTHSTVALTLDSLNVPHISFWKGDTSDLGYANKAGGSWSVSYPDTAGAVGAFSDVVLDSFGGVHIAYSNTDSWDTKYAYFDGESWAVQTIVTEGNAGYISNAILLDSNNRPQIVTVSSSNVLSTAKYNGDSWVISPVSSPAGLGYIHDAVYIDDALFIVTTSRKRGIYSGAEASPSWTFSQIADWGNPYSMLGGTSAAAPMAAGLAALLISAHPDWTLDQIYWAVASTAVDRGTAGHDKYYGWGRINAKAALDIAVPLVDTTPPVAEITYPLGNTPVGAGETVNILGSATDDNFTRYNLLYRHNSWYLWQPLAGYERSQKENGVLGIWNTSGLSTGWYDLKLEVSDFYTTTTEQISVYVGYTGPTIYVNSLTPDPGNDDMPAILGLAVSQYANIVTVEHQMDGTDGEWVACDPSDGAFNSDLEQYICQVGAPLSSGAHTIYVRGTDTLGFTTPSNRYGTDSFVIDKESPTDISIVIEGGAEYATSHTVSLELSAEDQGSTVSQMMLSENENFTGANWEGYLTTKTWSFSAGDGVRELYVKFKDQAGNESETTSDSIILDTTSPQMVFSEVKTDDLPIRLAGTATDALVNVVGVGYKLNNGSWLDATPDDGAFNSLSEGFGLEIASLGDGIYTLFVRAEDSNGNITVSYSQFNFAIDNQPPVNPRVVIHGGSVYAFSRAVILYPRADDPISGVTQMMISESPYFPGAYWEAYSTARWWQLSYGDGWKHVYVKFKDAKGNESTAAGASIVLDSLSPDMSFTRCDRWSSGGLIMVTGVAVDAGSPITRIEYQLNGSAWKSTAPIDGRFDSGVEYFSLRFRKLKSRTYYMNFRAIDANGHVNQGNLRCVTSIENTKPVARIYAGQTRPRSDSTTHLRGYARDNWSGVGRVETRIDNGRWVLAVPQDGAYGGRKENFLVDITGLRKGSHRLQVVAFDQSGNRMRTYTYRFRVR